MKTKEFSGVIDHLQAKGWTTKFVEVGTRCVCTYEKNGCRYLVSFPYDIISNRVARRGKVYGQVEDALTIEDIPFFEISFKSSEPAKWGAFRNWLWIMFNVK